MRPDRRVEQNAQPTPDPTQACARCIACAAASAPAQQAQSAPTHQSAPSAAHTARNMPGHSAHMSPGASCNSRLPPCRSPRRFLCPPPGGPQPPGGTKTSGRAKAPACPSLPRGPTHAPLSSMRAPIARSPEPFGPGTPNLDLSSPSRAPPHACRSNSKRKSNGLKRARLGNRPVIRNHSRRPRGRRQPHAGNEEWDIGLRWVFLQPLTWPVRPPCCSVSNIHQKFK